MAVFSRAFDGSRAGLEVAEVVEVVGASVLATRGVLVDGKDCGVDVSGLFFFVELIFFVVVRSRLVVARGRSRVAGTRIHVLRRAVEGEGGMA